MGLGKILKKVGKVALKTAPIWMSAVPGIGTAAGIALSGAASAADKKLSGGSWKSSLLAGGIGAGSALAAGQSSKLLGKLGGGASKGAVKGAAKGAAGFSDALPDISQTAFGGGLKTGTEAASHAAFDALPDISNGARFGSDAMQAPFDISQTTYADGISPVASKLSHPDLGVPGAGVNTGANMATGKGSNLLGGFGKYAKDNPMLMLSLASILGGAGGDDGGGGGGNGRRGYDPKGFANPEDSLSRALQASHRLGQGMLERGPRNFSALLPAQGPAPVNIAGVQIGGGLHTPEQLTHDQSIDAFGDLNKYDPFQSVGGVEKMKSQPRRT